MDKKLFKRLVESMDQMDEIVRGVRVPSREFYVDAAKVKEIRALTGLSQPQFAKLLHVEHADFIDEKIHAKESR